MRYLDDARQCAADPIEGPPPTVLHKVLTGKKGRPKYVIDHKVLAGASKYRGPKGIAQALECSAKTVRRRLLEHKLAEPGGSVITSVRLPDGRTLRIHHGNQPRQATLTAGQLDNLLHNAKTLFPGFGRAMLQGYVRSQGHYVTDKQLRESYWRVFGMPTDWVRRTIERKAYSVAGPNSLCHHDGQHGLYSTSHPSLWAPAQPTPL